MEREQIRPLQDRWSQGKGQRKQQYGHLASVALSYDEGDESELYIRISTSHDVMQEVEGWLEPHDWNRAWEEYREEIRVNGSRNQEPGSE